MVYSEQLFKDDISLIASTGRFINIANIYNNLRYRVHIATYSSSNEYYVEEKEGLIIHYLPRKKLNKIQSFLRTGSIFVETLESVMDLSIFESVVYYGTTLKYTKPLKKLARNYDMNTISIVNEWGNFKIKSTLSYILQKLGIYYVTKNYDGIIGISSFMQKFFDDKNVECITIPSIFDLEQMPRPLLVEPKNDIVTISYAGTIANGKDSMGVVLEALAALSSSDRARVRLNLYGSTKEQVYATLGEKADAIMSKLENVVSFKGHYSRVDLQTELIKSTFCILVRPNKPYANAGFPTKFAESLTLGVPMIANGTSDIAKYLKTNHNGILLKDDSFDSVKSGFEKMLKYDSQELVEMKKNSFKDASLCFNQNNYADALEQFMSNLGKD